MMYLNLKRVAVLVYCCLVINYMNAAEAITEVNDNNELSKLIKTAHEPIVLEFYSDVCPVCRQYKSTFESFANSHEGKAKFVTSDIDHTRAMSKKYNVTSIPAIIFISSKGDVVEHFQGATSAKDLAKALNKIKK